MKPRTLYRFIACGGLALLSGCGSQLTTDYGKSKGYFAQSSLNGFTVFRQSWEDAGYQSTELTRMSDRMRSTSVIVWTPPQMNPLTWENVNWLNDWMRQGRRTLVYVVPDSGSEAAFYAQAYPLTEPSQRLKYRRRYAEVLVREHSFQVRRSAYSPGNWFTVRPHLSYSPLVPRDGTGEDPNETDANERGKSDGLSPSLASGNLQQRSSEWVIESLDRSAMNNRSGSYIGPTGPSSTDYVEWYEVSDDSFNTKITPLVTTEDGDALVAKVVSDQWPNSQILVVANGSALTNFGLTDPSNQSLAKSLIDDAVEIGRGTNSQEAEQPTGAVVAFTDASGGILVSEPMAEIPRATGAEMLAKYPLSVVTIHGAVLGLVICLMLMPVLGRPRKVPHEQMTDFGDHIEAVALLMQKRGGEQFARQRISDYMTRIRGETHGPWVAGSDGAATAVRKVTVNTLSLDKRKTPGGSQQPPQANVSSLQPGSPQSPSQRSGPKASDGLTGADSDPFS